MNRSALIPLVLAAAAAGPTTKPDATADILGLSTPATTKPATTRPAAAATPAPPSVFKSPADDGETRDGTVTLSDGSTVAGKVSTTAEKPVRIWVEAEKQYEDVALSQVAAVEARVVWERDEKEWNFKASGSDVKVYSGKTYPARQTQYTFTLTDGTVLTGDSAAPLYVTPADGKPRTLVLHKRDKGAIGTTLKQLVYVTKVTLK